MPDLDWAAVERAFDAALDLPPDRRGDALTDLAPDVRAEVEALLSAHAQTDTFLENDAAERALVEAAADAVTASFAGREVGPYRLVRLLAQGGMGAVHLAERTDDLLGLPVALKLLPPGFASAELVARFQAERHTLGRLAHPHITRLLDGGESDGRPYFAMEYVDGPPLTDFCEAERLGVDERLRLVLQVCDAVAYAHGQGVIHRDLKPPNLLVTGHGDRAAVKLLDFGIAKLLESERAVLTRTGVRLYTPAYAAPEQITSAPITPATDVYALGVLLYVLLAGRHPYLRGDEPPFEAMRAVTDAAPDPPSAAVTDESAAALGLSADALQGRLHGALDRIVLQALAKAPADRYATADALAADLRRVLAGEPVAARRPTAFGEFLHLFRPGRA